MGAKDKQKYVPWDKERRVREADNLTAIHVGSSISPWSVTGLTSLLHT
jgi:hypothetical protein